MGCSFYYASVFFFELALALAPLCSFFCFFDFRFFLSSLDLLRFWPPVPVFLHFFPLSSVGLWGDCKEILAAGLLAEGGIDALVLFCVATGEQPSGMKEKDSVRYFSILVVRAGSSWSSFISFDTCAISSLVGWSCCWLPSHLSTAVTRKVRESICF